MVKRMHLLIAFAILMVSAAPLVASPQPASKSPGNPIEGEGMGLEPLATVPWHGGTDLELAKIGKRVYAFGASDAPVNEGGGLHIVDVSDPNNPKEVSWVKCTPGMGGDVQLSHDRKTAIMAYDFPGREDSCNMLGTLGFQTIDVSDPSRPRVVGLARIEEGSHNITAHPTKPYVYNSNSEFVGNAEIQIWSIKNPAKPKLVNEVASLPHPPHDLSFNPDGTMAVAAAISHFSLWDTSDPENPTLLFESQCPSCTITHDAQFTPDGKGIVIGDESPVGLAGCPGGALHFYALVGDARPVAVQTGLYEPGELAMAGEAEPGLCTSHVFDISDDSQRLAVGWYTAGVRLLEIGDLTGVTIGDESTGGIAEVAWYIPRGGSTWAGKLYEDWPYVFTNDINLGLIIYEITGN